MLFRSVSQSRYGYNVRVLADLGGRANDGSRVNAGRVGWRLIEEGDGARKGEIGIFGAQCSGIDSGEIFSDDDGRGLRGLSGCGVLYVGDESELSWAGFFDTGKADNVAVVSFEVAIQFLCKFAEFHHSILIPQPVGNGWC